MGVQRGERGAGVLLGGSREIAAGWMVPCSSPHPPCPPQPQRGSPANRTTTFPSRTSSFFSLQKAKEKGKLATRKPNKSKGIWSAMARSWGETRCQIFDGRTGWAAGALLPAPRTSPAATAWPQAPSPSRHRPHPPQRDPCRARGFAVPPRTPTPRTTPLLPCNLPIPAQTSCSVPVAHRCPGQPSFHPDPEHTAPLGTSVSSPQSHLHPSCPRHSSFLLLLSHQREERWDRPGSARYYPPPDGC